MSWLFSRALEVAYSPDSFLDGEPSAPLSVMPTPHKFSRNGKTIELSNLSRFGLTCEVLTADRGEALLTSYLAAFRVKTLAQPERAPASKARDPAFGEKWQELSARYDLAQSSWKTHRCLWDEDLPWSSVTLPRWGLMLSGFVFQRRTLVRPIKETGSGFLPTPTATDANGRTYYYQSGTKETAVPSLLGVAKLLPTPAASDWKGRYTWETVRTRMKMTRGVRLPEELSRRCGQAIIPNPEFWEWMMGWPSGWTGLRPLETDKYQSWRQRHLDYLRGINHE